MKHSLVIPLLLISISAYGAQQYAATGMILKVDRAHNSFLASCQAIPGFMAEMSMSFEVRQAQELNGLLPGTIADFTIVVDGGTLYAEQVKIHPYISEEQDPWTARQLKFLRSLSEQGKSAPKPLAIGQAVPNFTLIDQARQRISLSQFAGKVVALNFIYTSCALPTYCYRMANNFGVLQRQFKEQLGRDLVLLTVSFDPQRDTPEALAHYSENWKANAKTWHFLTGPVPEVRRVTGMFGMDFFPDEGLMNHSLHTVIIDRQGKLVANIEGNHFAAEQLADLVRTLVSEKQGLSQVE